MVDLFEEESNMFWEKQGFSFVGEIAVCDDIKSFIERKLLLETDPKVIKVYQNILTHIKRVRKAIDEGMYEYGKDNWINA